MLHIRARKGSANTSRGAWRFVEELIARVKRPERRDRSCCGRIGFWNAKLMTRCRPPAGLTRSDPRATHIKAAITQILELDCRILTDKREGGEAQSVG